MPWPPPLLLAHAHLPWTLDATRAQMPRPSRMGLPWQRAFDEMAALEAGAIANADEGRQVGHYWLRAPELAPSVGLAQAIGDAALATATLADKVVGGRLLTDAGQAFTDVLHIGIGGSALGPQLLLDALGDAPDGQRLGLPIHFLDNTDPDGIARTLGRLGDRLATSLVVMVSKSGGTPEPRRALSLVRRAMRGMGLTPEPHLVAITAPGSALDTLAQQEGWRARLPIWDWVGGRFSLFSAVGLLPAELGGIDTAALLAGARDMDAWTRGPDPDTNPAAVLAAAWHHAGHGRGDAALVVLPYADRLLTLSRYLQQLVMESLGKRLNRHGDVVHQGLTVFGNKGSTDQHAFVQQLRDGRRDALVTFIQVLHTPAPDPRLEDGVSAGDQLQGFLLGTRRALAEDGRPSLTITVPQVDATTLGGLIALFERAVGLYASLIDVNAYHQPGVEAGKVAAASVLALSARLRSTLAEAPASIPDLARDLDAHPGDLYDLLRRAQVQGLAAVHGSPLTGVWSWRGKP